MAIAYTKEFLVDALVSRYEDCFEGDAVMAAAYKEMCSKHYDAVGKDTFRKKASLDADAIKEYKAKKK